MFMVVTCLLAGDDRPAEQVRRVNHRRRDLCFRIESRSRHRLMALSTNRFRLESMRHAGIRQCGASWIAFGSDAYAESPRDVAGRQPLNVIVGAGTEAGGRTP